MTAPAASRLTLSSELRAVTDLAVAELQWMWALTLPELTAALQDVLPSAVETWSVASASMAADWYDELRDRNGIGGTFRAIVYPTELLGAEVLAGWAAQPLRLAEPDLQAARYRAESGLQKRIANHANRTLTASAAEDPSARGYARVTRPGACRFCRMVASRGGVYTKATATFACHENCYCSAVPAWGGQPIPVDKYKPSDRPNNEQERERVRQWIADNLDDGEPRSSRRSGQSAAPAESPRDIAARHLPALERSLADLRAQGLPESSPQIQYHLQQIAKFRDQLRRR